MFKQVAPLKPLWLFLILFLQFSCAQPPDHISVDEEFNALFHLDKEGVTGTDGTISIPISDGRSVFLMGDFFLGEVIDGQRDSTPDMALGNVLITLGQDQKTVKNYFRGTAHDPEPFLTPIIDDPAVAWIWPGHGFEQDGILHLFMFNYTSDLWAFRGTDYVRLNASDFSKVSHERFMPSLTKGIRWGQAVINDSSHVYVYGGDYIDSLPQRNVGVHISRATVSDANRLETFTYFNGENWTSDPAESTRMEGLNISVSEQFSAFKLGKTYVLLTHERGFKNNKIYSYISDFPEGPWRNEQMLFETTEHLSSPYRFTYNAMAHPQYIKEGELLISYNSTSTNLKDIYTDATIYRPVFLRVPLGMILNDHN